MTTCSTRYAEEEEALLGGPTSYSSAHELDGAAWAREQERALRAGLLGQAQHEAEASLAAWRGWGRLLTTPVPTSRPGHAAAGAQAVAAAWQAGGTEPEGEDGSTRAQSAGARAAASIHASPWPWWGGAATGMAQPLAHSLAGWLDPEHVRL